MTRAELGVGIRDVPFDRRRAYRQMIGNLLVPEARGDEPENLPLAGRERLEHPRGTVGKRSDGWLRCVDRREPPAGVLAGKPSCSRVAQQLAHAATLVEKNAEVALGLREAQRPGLRVERGAKDADRVLGQRVTRQDLDEASDSPASFSRRREAFEQPDRVIGGT